MTYECKHFEVHEFVAPETYKLFKEHFGKQHFETFLWRIVPDEIKRTADWFRERYGKTTINNYKWNGNRSQSGLRLPSSEYYSATSQHTMLNAVDMVFEDYTADQIREDIKKLSPEDQKMLPFTRIEDKVKWIHADCKATNQNGIYFFNP